MAAPTPASLSNIVAEALAKGGHSNPSTGLTTRAEGPWMEEVKNDLVALFGGKKLKFLQEERVLALTEGLSTYDEPTDFYSDMSKMLMWGEHADTVQSGSGSTIRLASTDTITSTDAIGKEIMTTGGTGLNQIGQITAYNESTKDATISPALDTALDGTTTYMIIDTYQDLEEKPVFNLDDMQNQRIKGKPSNYYPIGDEDNGQFILWPTPVRDDNDKVYSFRQRYYVDLMRLDLASTLMTTLYRRWRNLWVQGVLAKIMLDDDDNRAGTEEQKYRIALQQVVARETYGMDLSNLSLQVKDSV